MHGPALARAFAASRRDQAAGAPLPRCRSHRRGEGLGPVWPRSAGDRPRPCGQRGHGRRARPHLEVRSADAAGGPGLLAVPGRSAQLPVEQQPVPRYRRRDEVGDSGVEGVADVANATPGAENVQPLPATVSRLHGVVPLACAPPLIGDPATQYQMKSQRRQISPDRTRRPQTLEGL